MKKAVQAPESKAPAGGSEAVMVRGQRFGVICGSHEQLEHTAQMNLLSKQEAICRKSHG
jgi:hypothetical protein